MRGFDSRRLRFVVVSTTRYDRTIVQGESTVAQSSARGLSRDYPMMNTATIADSRGASCYAKQFVDHLVKRPGSVHIYSSGRFLVAPI